MIYPNITDPEIRHAAAEQLTDGRRRHFGHIAKAAEAPGEFSRTLEITWAYGERRWIDGYRRALELLNDA